LPTLARSPRANYAGRYIKTRGPHDHARSPQGRPVFMQAGSSDRGREFAARWAEAIFCTMQTEADARAYYDDVKSPHGQLRPRPASARSVLRSRCGWGDRKYRSRKADYLDSLISGSSRWPPLRP